MRSVDGINKTTLAMGLSVVLNLVFAAVLVLRYQQGDGHDARKSFSLLHPGVSYFESNSFAQRQQCLRVNYQTLKNRITDYLSRYSDVRMGYYFEDLSTGSWVGIGEREKFKLASLLKIPLVAATLKQIEEGKLRLDNKAIVDKSDLNDFSGSLYKRGYGYEITVAQLIEHVLIESDNTAATVLERVILRSDIFDAITAMGVPLTSNVNDNFLNVSPRDYSNILRSLYHSSYLKRTNSQYILDLLTRTVYQDGLPAGVPSGVKVAHKMGFWIDGSYYLDCGIVYDPNIPYSLCMMIKGGAKDKQPEIMKDVSRITYEFVSRCEEE